MNPAVHAPARPPRTAGAPPHRPVPARPAGGPATGSSWSVDMRAQLRRGVELARQPRRWTPRGWVFATVLAVYLVFTALVLIPGTPPLRLDRYLADLHFGSHHYSWLPWVKFLVGFGQRWIMTIVLEVVVVVAALRARSIRPLVQFVLAIVLLNASVAGVKYSLGRVGPFYQDDVHKIFHLGGTIYPSGHVSNAVVLYGMLVMAIPRFRAPLAAFAVLVSVWVGLGTIYLRTHWFSDVIGGWLAGSLVLLAMPTLMPWAERFADSLLGWVRPLLLQRPRLHRAARSVLDLAMRIVPPAQSRTRG